MQPPPDPDSAREDRLDAVIAEYLQAAESGQTPDREAFLCKHADLADELAEFLDDREHFGQAASCIVGAPAAFEDTRPHGGILSTGEPKSATTHAGSMPRRVGDYELLEEIARGGMGVVYRAEQLSLRRPVAVKMILAGRLASAADVARFRSEAEAAARLDHPNIVPIYEVGEHEGQPYFSMRLVDGGDLTSHRADYRGNPRAAAELVAVLADAIHHAHQRGILHRDLKPRNILLDAGDKPQISDFGLAKLMEADGSLTQSGAVLGSASYMAPEQARGESSLTTASDVYSLGAILYELLTGRPPFRAATPAETIVEVLDKEPLSPRSVDPKIDHDLNTICLKCLEKDPSRRYGSAEALASDLRRRLDGRPIEARPVGALQRMWRGCRRNLALTSVIAVAVGIIVSMTGFYISSLNARNSETQDALRKARIAGDQARTAGEDTQDALARSRYEQARSLAIAGPPGRRWEILKLVAEVESLRTRKRFTQASLPATEESRAVLPRRCKLRSEAVAALLLTDARVRWQLEFPSNTAQPGLSGDTRQAISFPTKDQRKANVVVVTDLKNRQVLSRWEQPALHEATAFGLAPSVGLAVAFDAAKARLLLLEASSGNVLRELPWAARGASDNRTDERTDERPRFVWSSEIVFSPDGRSLAVVGRRSTEQTLTLWNLDSPDRPQALITIPENTDLGPPVFLPDGSKLAYATSRDVVTLWDLARPEKSTEIRSPIPLAGHLALDRSGRRLALAGEDADPNKGILAIWDLTEQRETARIATGFALKASPLAFHPTRDYLAAGTTDGRIFVVDLARRQTILSLPGAHNGRVVHLRWSLDGRDLISWGLDGILACREFGPSPTNEIATGSTGSRFVASPDGKWLATVHDDEEHIRLLDRQTGNTAHDFDSTALQTVKQLEFSPDSRSLAAADGYSAVAWDLTTGGEMARLDNAAGLRGLLTSVAFTPQGECLAAENTGSSRVSVWNVLEKRIVCSIETDRTIGTTMFCGGASRLATVCGADARRPDRLFVFESLTGKRLVDRELSGMLLGPASLSPDGSWLAILSRNGDSPLDEITKRQLGLPPSTLDVVVERFLEGGSGQTIAGPSAPAERACVFSPDGRLLALGYRDGSISLWDLLSREEVFHVRYRSLPITQLAFGRRGHVLLVGDAGRTIGTIDLARLQQDLAPLGLAW